MIDCDTIQKAIYALDLAQSLLEKSGHHQQIFDAYTNLRQAFAQPKREWVGLTDGEMESLVSQTREVPIEIPCDSFTTRLLKVAEAKLKDKNT